MNFKGKTVIVTGASKGIGQAIAIAFGTLGAHVVVNYNHSQKGAQDTVDSIIKNQGQALAIKADVSDYKQAAFLVEETIKQFGSIDILINNSGITKDQLMLRMREDDFDQVINVNLKGTWNMIKHVSRPMLKQKSGRIINITSVVGVIGNPGQANYVASKAGIIGLTKSIAKEFGKKQITVNAVAPGFIETDMTEQLPESIKQTYLEQIPLSRLGQTSDVANTVMFLASDLANYITGQVIHVNGGMV